MQRCLLSTAPLLCCGCPAVQFPSPASRGGGSHARKPIPQAPRNGKKKKYIHLGFRQSQAVAKSNEIHTEASWKFPRALLCHPGAAPQRAPQRVNPRPQGLREWKWPLQGAQRAGEESAHRTNTFPFGFALPLASDSEPESTQVIFVGRCRARGRQSSRRPRGRARRAGALSVAGGPWARGAGNAAASWTPSPAQPRSRHRARGVSSPGPTQQKIGRVSFGA